MKIPLPPLAEQELISTALDACDKDLETQQRLVAKLTRQKIGLLQQLLTGAVRVKVEKREDGDAGTGG
jgi:type I restriction enzyme, S subunit